MTVSNPAFPFALKDLKYWIVRRKDGTVVKHVLKQVQVGTGGQTPTTTSYLPGSTTGTTLYQGKLSDWCKHDPIGQPLWESEEESTVVKGEKAFELWIADAEGARRYRNRFDFIIDGGNVISSASLGDDLLTGDKELAAALEPYVMKTTNPRVLKIDWTDRAAPELHPEFWVELRTRLSGRVMVCCQGGHGRSGSSAVALMMVLTPEYSAKDAIIHLRAIHCPRAIESKSQHEYLNTVATYLGRTANALEVETIKDYREAFRELAKTSPTAARFLSRLDPPKKEEGGEQK